MLVVANLRRFDLKMMQQLSGVARIFSCDQGRLLKDPNRSKRNVFKVADGRSNEVEDASRMGVGKQGVRQGTEFEPLLI